MQEYRDEAIAIMDEGSSEHAGHFISATLKPRVIIQASRMQLRHWHYMKMRIRHVLSQIHLISL